MPSCAAFVCNLGSADQLGPLRAKRHILTLRLHRKRECAFLLAVVLAVQLVDR